MASGFIVFPSKSSGHSPQPKSASGCNAYQASLGRCCQNGRWLAPRLVKHHAFPATSVLTNYLKAPTQYVNTYIFISTALNKSSSCKHSAFLTLFQDRQSPVWSWHGFVEKALPMHKVHELRLPHVVWNSVFPRRSYVGTRRSCPTTGAGTTSWIWTRRSGALPSPWLIGQRMCCGAANPLCHFPEAGL